MSTKAPDFWSKILECMDTFRFTFFVSVTFYNSKTMKSKKKFQFWTIAENDSMSLNCIQDFPRSGATILTFLEYLITWFSLIQSNQFSICRLAINLANLQAPSWSSPTLVILLTKKSGCCPREWWSKTENVLELVNNFEWNSLTSVSPEPNSHYCLSSGCQQEKIYSKNMGTKSYWKYRTMILSCSKTKTNLKKLLQNSNIHVQTLMGMLHYFQKLHIYCFPTVH